MDFNPGNPDIKKCVESMILAEKGHVMEAGKMMQRTYNEAQHDFEKFIAAWFVARYHQDFSDRLQWLETSLQHGLATNDDTVKTAFPALYLEIARCNEQLGDRESAKKNLERVEVFRGKNYDTGPFFHGTKANLQTGDFLTAGFKSNYEADLTMNHIYFTASINGAGLAAELSKGEGHPRTYVVEPTGSFENDPNVTDKKFPGNLTRSYRTKDPLKIVGEVIDWKKLTPDELQKWNEKLANNKGKIIN